MESAARCALCDRFRSTLRSAVCRYNKRDSESRTQADSHTGYCHLTPDEKDNRMRNLYQSLRSTKQQVKRLESKAEALIQKKSVVLQPADADYISRIVTDITQDVKDCFPVDSPQRVFWESTMLFVTTDLP